MTGNDLNYIRNKLLADLRDRYYDVFQLILGVRERLKYITPIAACQLPELHVYGGAIRDAFWGITSKDVNVEVYGVMPITLWDLLADNFPGLVTLEDTRHQHLEVNLLDGLTISFQVPRVGLVYEPFIHGDPKITPQQASRLRDFTINSISYDIMNEVLYDHCDGLLSLASSEIDVCSDERALRDPEMPLRFLNLCKRASFTLSNDALVLLQENVKRNYPLSPSLYKLTISNLRNLLLSGGSIEQVIRYIELLDLSGYLLPDLTFDRDIRLDRLKRIWRTGMIQQLEGIKQFSVFLLPLLLPSDLSSLNNVELERSLKGLTHLQISGIQRDYIQRVCSQISRECHTEEDFVSCIVAVVDGDDINQRDSDFVRERYRKSVRNRAVARNGQYDRLPNPFEFESEFLLNAGQAPIPPGALAVLDESKNCIVRFEICSDYTVHVGDIEDRGDLYQYHIQRVECMIELLSRVLSFMKSNRVECGNFPMWIHVNDGTPPVRSVPIFCYALPLGFDNGILFPDWSFVDGYNCDIRGDWDTYRRSSEISLQKGPSWEDKEGKFFFSGRDTTKKLGIRNLLSHLPSDIFSIHIQDDDNYDIKSDVLVGVDRWSSYRYLLDLPGAYPWSVRFKELFLYGSIVIKVDLIDSLRRRPRWVNFYNSFFEEGRHYFRFDLEHSGEFDEDSESLERLKRELHSLHYQLESNMGYAKNVAKIGQQRANELTLEKVIGYCAYLIQRYRMTYFAS